MEVLLGGVLGRDIGVLIGGWFKSHDFKIGTVGFLIINYNCM